MYDKPEEKRNKMKENKDKYLDEMDEGEQILYYFNSLMTIYEECIKEGYNAFYEITEHVNENVFTFGCDEIKDECGKTWYGVSYNIYDSVEDQIKKVYY